MRFPCLCKRVVQYTWIDTSRKKAVQLLSNRRFGVDPLSDGEMHLIRGTYLYFQRVVCWETLVDLVRVIDSFHSYESCPCDTTRSRMEKSISLWGLRIFLTRCKSRNPLSSCRFVRFVRIVPVWHDSLSNGEMHLIKSALWKLLQRALHTNPLLMFVGTGF